MFTVLLSFSSVFATTGLKSSVYMRGMMFESIPLKRPSVRNIVAVNNFKNKQLSSLRVRLNPRLEAIRDLYKKNKKQTKLGDYNPFLDEKFILIDKLSSISQFEFPINIKLKINSTKNSYEFIHLSLMGPVDTKILSNYISELKAIFLKGFAPQPEKRVKGRLLSKKEKEMLEVLRYKKINFQNIEKLFGVQLGSGIIVDMMYYMDIKNLIGSEFAKILTGFREKFYHSSIVTAGVNSSSINDLASIIESENYKEESSIFVLPQNRLPKSVRRMDREYFDFSVKMISATNKQIFSGIESIFEKMINL
jgi:hypothetical protein